MNAAVTKLPGLPPSSLSAAGNVPPTDVPPASVGGHEFDEAARALLAADPESDTAEVLSDLIASGTRVIQALGDESMQAQLDAKSADLPLAETEEAAARAARLQHRVKRAESQLDALESRLSRWQQHDRDRREREARAAAERRYAEAENKLLARYPKLSAEILNLIAEVEAARVGLQAVNISVTLATTQRLAALGRGGSGQLGTSVRLPDIGGNR